MTPIRSIRNSSIRFALMATSVSIGSLISAFADTDHPVRYLHLQNDGKSKSNMFTKDLTKARGFCLDLEKFGDVPDGSEVWLKAYIALGDKESCRKDNPRIYQQGLPKGSATYTQQYKMGGQTLTNNMCKLSSGTEGKTESTNDIGNSTDCPYQ